VPSQTLSLEIAKVAGFIPSCLLSGLHSFPPATPVILVQDGHRSHISIELIEMACANDVTLLYMPVDTSHVLQSLDVGVFKSFQASFNKTCGNYMRQHPGQVITTDVLAPMVAQANQPLLLL